MTAEQLRNYGQGVPENKADQWQLKKADKSRSGSVERRINDPEVKEILDILDLVEIEEILLKEVCKSGSTVGNDRCLMRGDILLEENKAHQDNGNYNFISRLIRVFPKTLRERAIKNGLSLKSAVLRIVCHELTHDYSKTDVVGDINHFLPPSLGQSIINFIVQKKSRIEEKLTVKQGYRKTETIKQEIDRDDPAAAWSRPDEQKEYYINFDEGVTEKVCLEVMKEYLRRHRDFLDKKEQAKLFAVLTNAEKGEYYSRQMALVDELIQKLSEVSGFKKDIIWQALKRGKFGQENTNDPETLATLKEHLPPDFFQRAFNSPTMDYK